jgi:hypothetical protein
METKEYQLKSGNVLQVIHDEFAESPNTWYEDDNLFLVYDHRSFSVKREGFEPFDIYNDSQEYEKNYFVFSVDAYIHSGVHLSLFKTVNYPDRRWDVSTTGFVLVSKEEWKDEDKAKEEATSLLETWNQYLCGDIWGFKVVDEEGEELNSCWGFYGEDPEENGMMDHINDELVKEVA